MSLIPKAGQNSQYTATYGPSNPNIERFDHRRHRSGAGYPPCETALANAPAVENAMDVLLAMPDPVLVASLGGIIRVMNSRAEKLLDYSSADLEGRPISTVFTSDFDLKPLDKRFHPGSWHTPTNGPASIIHNKAGDLLFTDVARCDLIVNGAPLCAYRMTDASEISRLQNRIAEAERETALMSRLAILGELTAAIAHELSQPLTAISSYIAAARTCFASNADQRPKHSMELMSKAGAQAQRAWQIVQRLRTLLQDRNVSHRDWDLRQAVQDAIELATLGVEIDNFQIVKKIPDAPVMAKMDPVQIQILLANLIRNAIDELRVSTGRRIITIELRVNDTAAEVSVADTGPGIARHVQDSMFNPFLTTKPEGLGVGLAVSRRIAMAHGGHLEARNLEEGGAEFSFVIPVSVKQESR